MKTKGQEMMELLLEYAICIQNSGVFIDDKKMRKQWLDDAKPIKDKLQAIADSLDDIEKLKTDKDGFVDLLIERDRIGAELNHAKAFDKEKFKELLPKHDLITEKLLIIKNSLPESPKEE